VLGAQQCAPERQDIEVGTLCRDVLPLHIERGRERVLGVGDERVRLGVVGLENGQCAAVERLRGYPATLLAQ
jgi:hypothetical protein